MKTLSLLLITFFFTFSLTAQEITGQWNGLLKVQETQLRLVFNISKIENSLSSTMYSPEQSEKGIPTKLTSFENSTLKIVIENPKIEFEGTLGKDNLIIGTFQQNGQKFPLTLSKKIIEKEKPKRPQEPQKPYPYYSEDITFENKDAGILLAGTLTLPKSDSVFPTVILISGSGPQNRNGEILGHNMFLIISDYLTRNGIAVLRFDDRGAGQSTGEWKNATSLDAATDVQAALKYLKSRKEINQNKIGLVGHSEGGYIAPLVASNSKHISFIVLLAGLGIDGDKLLLMQNKLISKSNGLSDELISMNEIANKGAYEIVKKSESQEKLIQALTIYFNQSLKDSLMLTQKPKEISNEQFVKKLVTRTSSPFLQSFIKLKPSIILEKVKCPVLALNGDKDIQVPSKENLKGIKNALKKGKNKKVTIIELPNLNHLFQECITGSTNEYAKIEQTFSPIALTEILKWIKIQTKGK